MTEESATPPAEEDRSAPSAAVNKAPANGPWIAIALLLIILLAQLAAPWTDHQMTNIASAAMFVAVIFILLTWWRRKYSERPMIAYAPVAGIVAAAAAFNLAFRYDGVSGELVPMFSWRSSAKVALPKLTSQTANTINLESPDSFTGFLGNARNAVIPSREFSANWNTDPPQLLFQQPIGEGWSGFAIIGNHGFTMEQRDDEEWVTCYNLDNGNIVWKHAENARHENPLGGVGPRSTPLLHAGRIYTHGATGITLCLDALTGEQIWRVDLWDAIGVDKTEAEDAVRWGRSGSPLIVNDSVVLPFGADKSNEGHALIAFDATTGKLKWTSEGTGKTESVRQQISYASPVLATLAGQKLILSVNENDVSGYDCDDGKLLWGFNWPGASNGAANCSQPVVFDGNKVLVSKGYGGGGMLIEVTGDAAKGFSTKDIWQVRSVLKTKFSNVAVFGEHGFALSDGILECVNLRDGSRTWRQSRRNRYRHGQLLLIEDLLLVLAEDGRVALIRADPDNYEEIASIQAIEGKTWNNPSVAGRRLVVRNASQVASFMLPPRDN